MEETKIEVIKFLEARLPNKRISVYLLDINGEKCFDVVTRTLVDFRTRNIIRTDNRYSVETFLVMSEMFDHFTSNPEITNKILVREVARINKVTAKGNLNIMRQ
ncbi:hypothetical protein [Flagellimonas marina]|uniref:His-Xaa-Ser system protein HxsD n=1 Tax=Flagellimonas marina TaxID=1775168 RepID=A0ABV8PJF8_9FLAO